MWVKTTTGMGRTSPRGWRWVGAGVGNSRSTPRHAAVIAVPDSAVDAAAIVRTGRAGRTRRPLNCLMNCLAHQRRRSGHRASFDGALWPETNGYLEDGLSGSGIAVESQPLPHHRHGERVVKTRSSYYVRCLEWRTGAVGATLYHGHLAHHLRHALRHAFWHEPETHAGASGDWSRGNGNAYEGETSSVIPSALCW